MRRPAQAAALAITNLCLARKFGAVTGQPAGLATCKSVQSGGRPRRSDVNVRGRLARTAPRRAVAALMLLCASVAGCHLGRMQTPGELAGVAPLSVSGRRPLLRRPLPRFGDYSTREVHRSWVRGGREDGGFIAVGRFMQRYRFVLLENGVDRWAASCATTVRTLSARLPLGLEMGPGPRLELQCSLSTSDSLTHVQVSWGVSGPLQRGSGAVVPGRACLAAHEPSGRVRVA
jgi:hypothetical protein